MHREKISQALSAFVCLIAIALSVWIITANEAKALPPINIGGSDRTDGL